MLLLRGDAMPEVDVSAAVAGLDALIARLDEATQQAVADAAHIVQRLAMEKAPVGVTGNSTNAPGDLRRSIRVVGPAGGDGVYAATVAPYVVYGRQRELGGAIYGNPLLHFFRFGQEVFTHRVYQEPEPYLTPASREAVPLIEEAVAARVTVAILGG